MISPRRKRLPSSFRSRSCLSRAMLGNAAATSPHAPQPDIQERPAEHSRAPSGDAGKPATCRMRKKRHWVDDKVMFDSGRLDMMEIALRTILASSPDRSALVHRILDHVKVHTDAHDGTSPDAYLDGFSLQVTRLLY